MVRVRGVEPPKSWSQTMRLTVGPHPDIALIEGFSEDKALSVLSFLSARIMRDTPYNTSHIASVLLCGPQGSAFRYLLFSKLP